MNQVIAKTFVLLSTLFSVHGHAAERIEFTKLSFLADELITLKTSQLVPGKTYDVVVSTKDRAGREWKSDASYIAESNGEIDFDRAPIRGSYQVPHSQGLFWSMLPATYALDEDFFNPGSHYELQVQLVAGPQILSTAKATRLLYDDSLTVEQSRSSQGYYDLIFPKDAKRLPTVLLLGGSEGGLNCGDGKLISSSGYTVLCLSYFKVDGLPSELANIPLEYVNKTFECLNNIRLSIRREFLCGGLPKALNWLS